MTITGHSARFFRLLLILVLCALAQTRVGCRPHSPSLEDRNAPVEGVLEDSIGAQADCVPRFPDAAGWFGGDAAYSVPLTNRRASERTSLWLFGDSFVKRSKAREGRVYPFVHNTIGLSTCRNEGKWTLFTYWKGRGGGSPSAFFAPDPDAKWARDALAGTNRAPYYWLFDGFVAHDALFVGLLRVVHSEPRGPFNLPFRLVGMDLARIENRHDPPEQWRIQLSTLSDDPVAFPGSAFVVAEDHLYAFVFFDRGDGRSPRALARLPLSRLRTWQPNLSAHLETLGSEGEWEDGFRPDRAKILMPDDATEMSVHFDPSLGRWLAIWSNAIQIRSALDMEGPWSPPQDLYVIPETLPGIDGHIDENIFCYAAKAHPQFAPAGRLLITYVCNLFARNESEIIPVLRRLADSPDLYRAKAVSLPIPSTLTAGSTGK